MFVEFSSWFGNALTRIKDFYVARPNVTMFGLGFVTATALWFLFM